MSLYHKKESQKQHSREDLTPTTYEQLRAVHDSKHKNYFNHLQLHMQKNRTKINSAPIVKKYDDKGNIQHEPNPKTVKAVNYHSSALNHSVVPMNARI
mgnify:FL=1